MGRILLSPHADDECLFAAYTLIRYKPCVVVCTDYDGNRGTTSEQRRNESIAACGFLGCPVVFLGIPESKFCYESLVGRLGGLVSDVFWTPASQGGHPHHDIVARIPSLFKYATYTRHNLSPSGDIEIRPTEKEIWQKKNALSYYKTQLELNIEHFEAVEERSEFYISR